MPINEELIEHRLDDISGDVSEMRSAMADFTKEVASVLKHFTSVAEKQEKSEETVSDHETRIRAIERASTADKIRWKIMAWVAGLTTSIILIVAAAMLKPLFDQNQTVASQMDKMIQIMSQTNDGR